MLNDVPQAARLACRCALMLALVGWWTPATAWAQCEGRPGAPIRLDRAQTRECIGRLMWIEHAIVQGTDVVAAIASSDRPVVRVRSSVIEGGLYFDELPETPVAGLPDELRRRLGDLGYGDGDRVHLVPARLELPNTRILQGPAYDGQGHAPVALEAGRAVFLEDVDLQGSAVEGSAMFGRAVFLAASGFGGVRFTQRVTFDGAAFLQAGAFADARFAGTTLFTYVRFERQADFRRSGFEGQAIFDKARLCGRADFGESVFPGGARFVGMQVAGDAVFRDVGFPRGGDFVSAHFAGALDLARLGGDGVLTLSDARIGRLNLGSDEYRSRIDIELDFSDAWIAEAYLTGIRVDAPVSFSRVRLGGPGFETDVYRRNPEPRMQRAAARAGCASPGQDDGAPEPLPGGGDPIGSVIALRDVSFYDRVTFDAAQLHGRATFDGVVFRAGASMRGIVFAPDSRVLPFAGLTFAEVDLDWPSVAPFAALAAAPGETPASDVLEELELRFAALGDLPDMLSARRARRWAQTREALQCVGGSLPAAGQDGTATPDCSSAGAIGRLAVYPLWGLVSGFGTLPWRLLLVLAVVNLLFAGVYARARVLRRRATQEDSSAVRLRPLVSPAAFAPTDAPVWLARPGFRPALALSTVVLLRWGPADMAVRGTVGGVDVQRFVALEWALGIPLLVDLVYTLTETLPFLQRILTGTIA